MTKEQMCIKELYELVDRITQNACKHDLSLFRVGRGACGCDMYQGLPPICRIRDDILNRYEDIIYEDFEEKKDELLCGGGIGRRYIER